MPVSNKFIIDNVRCKNIFKRILHSKFCILNSKRGFTLVELMIAVAIMAIIATIGVVAYSGVQTVGRDARRKQDLRSIAFALEIYYQKNKRYPCSTVDAGDFGWDSSSPTSSNWIKDACASPVTFLVPDYISSLPVDPSRNSSWWANGGGYGYYSLAWGNCPLGQHYFLATILENSTDKDRYNANKVSHCNQPTLGWPDGNNWYFVIASP